MQIVATPSTQKPEIERIKILYRRCRLKRALVNETGGSASHKNSKRYCSHVPVLNGPTEVHVPVAFFSRTLDLTMSSRSPHFASDSPIPNSLASLILKFLKDFWMHHLYMLNGRKWKLMDWGGKICCFSIWECSRYLLLTVLLARIHTQFVICSIFIKTTKGFRSGCLKKDVGQLFKNGMNITSCKKT